MNSMNNKKLVGVLIVCGVVIIGLIVGIVVVVNSQNKSGSDLLSEETDCSLAEDDDARRECLAEVSENSDEAVVEASYDKVMDTALEEDNYFFYADTLNDRISSLIADGKCDEAMKMLDETKINDNFPPVELEYFYRFARDAATMCHDETRAAEYDKKDQDLLNSGRMPVFEEVEDVPPVDAEEEATGAEE